MSADSRCPGANKGDIPVCRGHWRGVLIGIIVAFVLGVVGGVVGYRLARPVWSSTGTIHVRAPVTPLLRLLDGTEDMRAYTSFRQAQASLLKQQRVIDMALQSPEWRALHRSGTTDEVWADFLDRLQVVVPTGGEMVLVTFTDPDRAACVAAVKGLLRAYSRICVENEERQQEEKLHTLESLRIAYLSDRDARREAILAIAREFGTDDLRPIHRAGMTALGRLESELRLVESKLAAELDGDSASPSRKQLEASRQRHQELILAAKREAKDLGLKMVEIERLREEEKDKSTILSEVTRRLETLQIERKSAGRIEIISWGDRPVCVKEPRPLVAGLGAILGLLLGVGLGAVFRRVLR